MPLRLSIIIPVYNRVRLLAHPLDSLRAAQLAHPEVEWELLIVDDGSTEDIAPVLSSYPDLPLCLIRQANSGLLAARLRGLREAQGEAVCFLDGDDAVSAEKFGAPLEALFTQQADVVHGDMGRRRIDAEGQALEDVRQDPPARHSDQPSILYLEIQPAPHDPIFRRTYLLNAIGRSTLPPERAYDPIAETWFYYQLCLHPTHISYVSGAHSIVGEPPGDRLSGKWEGQYAAACHLMAGFLANIPHSTLGAQASQSIARCAFATWRALPHGFPYEDRMLAIWRQVRHYKEEQLGGRIFSIAAKILGPVAAGRIFRRWQRPSYTSIRTLSVDELDALFSHD